MLDKVRMRGKELNNSKKNHFSLIRLLLGIGYEGFN